MCVKGCGPRKQSNSKLARCLVFIVSAMWLTGCTHHNVPTPDRPFESITEFTSTSSISLLNGQQSDQEIPFAYLGPHTHYANYKAWTDVAITIAKRELEKRGMRVIKEAPRTLTISVVSVHTGEKNVLKIETTIVINAETSEGYQGRYKGVNNSVIGVALGRQIDGALMRAVVEMLRDQQIVNFLKN